ncbi:MAG TPA: glutamate--tRNA ligase [Acidimicrobiales bacterium]|nr:glutamate--tRNA ligase [Acidimicrobiales bacterium]
MSDVRVRFAPSPTGFLHVGGARTVLFNWLYARHTGGEFLLRVEDTDTMRNRPELTEAIFSAMEWLGLGWDGDVVYQSGRFDHYRDAADRLIASGAAYACDCTADAVAARAKERGGPPGYDGHCRDRELEPGEGRALRFRSPDEGTTDFDDLIRGHVSVRNDTIEDFVLLRSNGTPTFLLANVTDDADMAITHVIRGEEHVNGTPKYLLIGDALGLDYSPVFAHLPLLVDAKRRKLSKRRDDVAVGDFREKGFLPEAMVNYLALLGWGPSDGVEVRPLGEIVEQFDLVDVNPSPAFFDEVKLTHINGEYLRALDVDAFLERSEPFLTGGDAERAALAGMAPLVQERVKTLTEVPDMIDFLWREPEIVEADWDKHVVRGAAGASMIAETRKRLGDLDESDWMPEKIQDAVVDATVALGFVNDEGRPRLAKTQGPVRVALTGRAVGPPLWEAVAQLGREHTLARLDAALARAG